jgi:menaquinone-9 beta-reductase
MEQRPLIIIGSGPAGAATALFLAHLDPQLAREVTVLEKAAHPRAKVCAGGLIPHTLDCLRELNVPLSVPHAIVHRARVQVGRGAVAYEGRELCRVVRRDAFDHALVTACRARGIAVRENEKVVDVRREPGGIRVDTERSSYRTRIVVGADGAGSVVRRRLFRSEPDCVGKAVMCDVPVAHADWSGFSEQRYDFSFQAVRAGLRGYSWVFPCLIGDVPHANVGVYSVDARGNGAPLARLLREQVARLGVSPAALKSFPIRWYGRPAGLSAPHAMLAGDAAGVDPLMGEGISFAFEYGRRAAASAAHALTTGDFGLADYQHSIDGSWVGKKLRRLHMAVQLFYGPTWWLWFALAACSPQAREIGIRWYNGVDEWDRRSGREALRAWWRGDLGAAAQRSLP